MDIWFFTGDVSKDDYNLFMKYNNTSTFDKFKEDEFTWQKVLPSINGFARMIEFTANDFDSGSGRYNPLNRGKNYV